MKPIARRTPYIESGDLLRAARIWHEHRRYPQTLIEMLETELKEKTDAANALTASSARASMFALMRSLPHENRRKVIITTYTFYYIPWIINATGFIPVFLDPEPSTARPSLENILNAVDDETAAVVITHLFGLPGEAAALKNELKNRGVLVIEDATHTLGATLEGRQVGSIGDAAIISFGVGKLLPAGGGGALLINNPELSRGKIASFLVEQSGKKPFGAQGAAAVMAMSAVTRWSFPYVLYPLQKYGGEAFAKFLDDALEEPPKPPGHPDGMPKLGKISPFSAAMVLAQLENFDEKLARIRRNAGVLRSEFDGVAEIDLLQPSPKSEPLELYFRIMIADPADFRRRAIARGLDTKKDDMKNCAPMFGGDENDFPNANRIIERSVEIPCPPFLQEEDMRNIARIVKDSI